MTSKDHYFLKTKGKEKWEKNRTKQNSTVVISIYQCTCVYVYTWAILPPLLIEMSLSHCFSNANTLMNHLRKPLKCRLWDRKCGMCPESSHLCKFLRKKIAIWCSGTACRDWMAYFYFSPLNHFSTKVTFLRLQHVFQLTGELWNTCTDCFYREMLTP